MGWGSGISVGCGVGHRYSSDPVLLWRRPVAIAPIEPLAWEPPYAASVSLKKKKKCENKVFGNEGHKQFFLKL